MDNDRRLPRGRKLERRIMLIERLWDQIPFYMGSETPVEAKACIEKNYPDWKKGQGYSDLIQAARHALRSPFNYFVEGSFNDGFRGGVVSRPEHKSPSTLINYDKIVDRIAESTYRREVAAKPSEEEIRNALENANARGREELDRVFDELDRRLPRNIDTIRYEVFRKVNDFLLQRYEKTSANGS